MNAIVKLLQNRLMMATSFFVSLLLLTACIGEELINVGTFNEVDNNLRFEASAGLTSTKAALGNPMSTTADLQALGHFFVSAFSGDSVVLSHERVLWDEGVWQSRIPLSRPVRPTIYVAYTNWQDANYSSFRISKQGITVAGVTIDPDPLILKGQRDLLLASTYDTTDHRSVHLHFSHPLTQISFRAGNIAPQKIDVLISEISIVNVSPTADLIFPNAQGGVSWSNHTSQRVAYTVQGIAEDPEDISQAYVVPDLSASPTDYARFPRIQMASASFDNSLLLIPQEFESWDPTSSLEATLQSKAYLRLRILIKRAGLNPSDSGASHFVYAGAVDPITQTFLPTYAYAPLASIPKKTGHWQGGKRINYILNFGDNFAPSGGGGYDKDGKPILVPIRFSLPITAIVDDWLNAFVPLITISYPKQ